MGATDDDLDPSRERLAAMSRRVPASHSQSAANKPGTGLSMAVILAIILAKGEARQITKRKRKVVRRRKR
jgi:hypothetical protein